MTCRDCGKNGCKQTLTGTCQGCEHEHHMKRKEIRKKCKKGGKR